MDLSTRYLGPTGIDPIMGRIANWLPRLGIGIAGSRLLAVRGRKSGEWRTTMVNLMVREDGARFLVAPRGHTQWVRNLRVAGDGELRLGRKVEAFTADEIPDADKVALLRLYLRKWGWEVGRFFEGVSAHSTDEELAAIAPGFPVFRIYDRNIDRAEIIGGKGAILESH
ncbi:nitroreductase family deazaflavin-dependent oxidoreductase [Nocardia callitridis]|uniref:Nitroreductase family deazaflavin-dependent oxidoreductase n=1 Tax=Nocardia callitridis TaxID=648753 RepID=A0ABP9JWW4_9NOCA